MTTTLTQAFEQWSSRPADERFASLADLHASALASRERAREAKEVPYSSLRTQADEGRVLLVGKANVPSELNHWSFGQLAQRVGAPASYLRELPATLAAQNLNHGLATIEPQERANVLLDQNGKYRVRAFNSDKYTRIWDADVTSRLIRLTEEQPEWQPAPPAFNGSRGLYRGDRDMFAFMVDNERRIFETDSNGGLGRGFFVWNSEVGSTSFGVTKFLYEYVCGNHRVWGARQVSELRVRHVGAADERAFRELAVELRRYAEGSAAEDEALVLRAKMSVLGKNKDEVLDRVFGLKLGLSRRAIGEGYDLAERREDWYGAPNTAWGLAGGLTEAARDLSNADERVAMDRAAGKVMEVAF